MLPKNKKRTKDKLNKYLLAIICKKGVGEQIDNMYCEEAVNCQNGILF